jgi:hypothetical protein
MFHLWHVHTPYIDRFHPSFTFFDPLWLSPIHFHIPRSPPFTFILSFSFFFNSTYKTKYVILDFLSLPYLVQYTISDSIHFPANDIIYSTLWLSKTLWIVMPHFLYPFLPWWSQRLIPLLDLSQVVQQIPIFKIVKLWYKVASFFRTIQLKMVHLYFCWWKWELLWEILK